MTQHHASDSVFFRHEIVVVGDRNQVFGPRCSVFGDLNTVYGDRSGVFGNHNVVRGRGSLVYGRDNACFGDECTVVGTENYCGGRDCKVTCVSVTPVASLPKTSVDELCTLLGSVDLRSDPGR